MPKITENILFLTNTGPCAFELLNSICSQELLIIIRITSNNYQIKGKKQLTKKHLKWTENQWGSKIRDFWKKFMLHKKTYPAHCWCWIWQPQTFKMPNIHNLSWLPASDFLSFFRNPWLGISSPNTIHNSLQILLMSYPTTLEFETEYSLWVVVGYYLHIGIRLFWSTMWNFKHP